MIVLDSLTGEIVELKQEKGNFYPYTIDNETRLIPISVYKNHEKIPSLIWDEELLVQNVSDMMDMNSLCEKRVLIVKMSEWKRGRKVEILKPFRCVVCKKPSCLGECDEDSFLELMLI